MSDQYACAEGRLDDVERVRRRLGPLDPRQVAVWRPMTPARRLGLDFQTRQFALEVVRPTERRRHPGLLPEELSRRVIRRMLGDLSPGRDLKE